MNVGDLIPAQAPGAEVRFRIADERFGSGSSWKVQTAKNAGDLYLSHREGGHWVKASFHESGQWHFKATGMTPGAPATYLGVTRAHPEIAPGWVHAARITVANTQLRAGYSEWVKGTRVIDVPLHPDFNATSVDVFIGTHSAALIKVELAIHIAQLRTTDGRQVHVLAIPTMLDAAALARVQQDADRVRDELLHQGAWDGMTPTRAVMFGVDGDQFLREVELAIDPLEQP